MKRPTKREREAEAERILAEAMAFVDRLAALLPALVIGFRTIKSRKRAAA